MEFNKNMKIFDGHINLDESSSLVKKHTEEARERKLSDDPKALVPPGVSKIPDTEYRFQHYAEHYMRVVIDHMWNNTMAAALFDRKGLLMRLWGSDNMIGTLQREGVKPGCVFGMEYAGPNAVAVGTLRRTAVSGNRRINYNRALKNLDMYYVPVNIAEREAPFTPVFCGGIAFFSRKEGQDELMQALACGAAYNVLEALHHYRRHYKYYGNMHRGILTIDTLNGAEPFVNIIEEPFYSMLGIPVKDYRGMAVDKVFRPLPANARFHEIIRNMESVKDEEITLEIGNVKQDCIVTTDAFWQPMIRVGGIHFFINTPQWIAREVADKMAKNAMNTFDMIVGESVGIKRAIQRARVLSNTDSNVMILGESGVGKDVFAQAIHNSGKRKEGPFIAINCGALSRDLIASELFGYEAGAFTGAKKQGNMGKFELASGGTLFLDEIGELPIDMQATLLRAVEQKKIIRIGGQKEIAVDVRIICATNVSIPDMIESKRFREDLYYRLSTFEMQIPPLRERGDDVIVLSEFFIKRICQKMKRSAVMRLTEEAKELLRSQTFRGNVRELQNLIEGIVQLYPGELIIPEYIEENLKSLELKESGNPYPLPKAQEPVRSPARRKSQQGKKLHISKAEIEETLNDCYGNRTEAAKNLGISRRTLYKYIHEYGIDV